MYRGKPGNAKTADRSAEHKNTRICSKHDVTVRKNIFRDTLNLYHDKFSIDLSHLKSVFNQLNI